MATMIEEPFSDIGSAIIFNGELKRWDGKTFYFDYGTLRDFEKWAAAKIAETGEKPHAD